LILFHRQRQRDALIRTYDTGLGFGTISLGHGGWALKEFSAYHASFFIKPQIPAESGKSSVCRRCLFVLSFIAPKVALIPTRL